MAGGSKSKTKGSGFERSLAKTLEKVFGGKFIRTANSGAFVGGLNAGRKAGLSRAQISGQKGDLIPPDHMPKFVIEAKAYKEFRFHQLLQPDPMPQLEEWIRQAEDAVDPGDFWIIAFKVDRLGTYVFIPSYDWQSPQFVLGNYAQYREGAVTDLDSFLAKNKDVILALTAWPSVDRS